MGRKFCGRLRWNAADEITRAVLVIGQRLERSFLALEQALPDAFEIAAERRHPTAGREDHAALRRSTAAFVPPKPKELESAYSNGAWRASFATMFNRRTGSSLLKLMLGGRNWCC